MQRCRASNGTCRRSKGLYLIIDYFNQHTPMNRSRVKWFIRIFLLFSSSDTPLFFLLSKSRVLIGPAAAREWAIKKLVAVWPPQPSRTRRSSANRPNVTAANQTECVFQTPIRADHTGRYIRLTTGQAPILCDVMPCGSTLRYDRDARLFAASVFFFMPPYPIVCNA